VLLVVLLLVDPCSQKLAIFSLEGHMLLQDGGWVDLGPVKYEGIEFLGFHPLV
jgi:hypothetical protein